MTTVLFTGDRNENPLYDRDVRKVLRDLAQREDARIIVGDCPTGVDRLVYAYARDVFHIPVQVYAADWERFGKSAGPIRNAEMIKQSPNLVIAIHADYEASKGTKNCCQQAIKAGITTVLLPREADFSLRDYEL